MATIEFDYEDVASFTSGFSKKIGEGGYGEVYEGRIPYSNKYKLKKQKIAVKKLKRMEKMPQFEIEVDWLKKLKSRGIVKYLGKCQTENSCYIILEHIKRSDLSKNIEGLSWSETLRILKRIARTIKKIHRFNQPSEGGLVIADLKCANILLTQVCDFGSITIEGEDINDLTPGYLDPYAYKRGKRRQGDDIYSFGIIMLQLLMKETHTITDGKSIAVKAQKTISEETHLVHQYLVDTGCKEETAHKISKLAVDLTYNIEEEVDTYNSNSYNNLLRVAMGVDPEPEEDLEEFLFDQEVEEEVEEQIEHEKDREVQKSDEICRPSIEEILRYLHAIN